MAPEPVPAQQPVNQLALAVPPPALSARQAQDWEPVQVPARAPGLEPVQARVPGWAIRPPRPGPARRRVPYRACHQRPVPRRALPLAVR